MTILGRSEELVSRCVECDLAEPESLSSLGGSAPGVVDGILSPSVWGPLLCKMRHRVVWTYGIPQDPFKKRVSRQSSNDVPIMITLTMDHFSWEFGICDW